MKQLQSGEGARQTAQYKTVTKAVTPLIRQGERLGRVEIASQSELDACLAESGDWLSRTVFVLEALQDGRESAKVLVSSLNAAQTEPGASLAQRVGSFRAGMAAGLFELSRVLHRAKAEKTLKVGKADRPIAGGRRVFVIHGHDLGLMRAVEESISSSGLEPVVLWNLAKGSRAIIELVDDMTDVAFAVAILTPDDLGRAKDHERLDPRARENVIFEVGYLMGKLGRDRVVLLHKGHVNRPSDLGGVAYIDLDRTGWEEELAREFRKIGLLQV